MAKPIFFSYSWDDADDADVLDACLRLRGVPVWRDRRGMRWGGYNETTVRTAIQDDCSGFVLYVTESVFSSTFIRAIELDEMEKRRRRGDFFVGGVFRNLDIRGASQRLEDECGVDLGNSLGSGISDEDDFETKTQEAAQAILASYLHQTWDGGPVAVRLDTRDDIPYQDAAALHLAWSPPLVHDPDHYGEEVWRRELLPALEAVRRALQATGGGRRIRLRGKAHLSAALAFGYEFRQPTGWTIELEHRECPCETALVEPERHGWIFNHEPHAPDPGGRLVVCVHASHDVGRAMTEHGRTLPPARAAVHVYPPDGRPGRDKVDPAEANALAAAIAEEIREAADQYNTRETHLYVACPWPLAVLLGWHLASSGVVIAHEATVDRRNYRSACRLS